MNGTTVVLRDGRRLPVFNIAWGNDVGDDHSHVTTNISPGMDGATVDLFPTSDITSVLDDTGAVIYGGPSLSRGMPLSRTSGLCAEH